MHHAGGTYLRIVLDRDDLSASILDKDVASYSEYPETSPPMIVTPNLGSRVCPKQVQGSDSVFESSGMRLDTLHT